MKRIMLMPLIFLLIAFSAAAAADQVESPAACRQCRDTTFSGCERPAVGEQLVSYLRFSGDVLRGAVLLSGTLEKLRGFVGQDRISI